MDAWGQAPSSPIEHVSLRAILIRATPLPSLPFLPPHEISGIACQLRNSTQLQGNMFWNHPRVLCFLPLPLVFLYKGGMCIFGDDRHTHNGQNGRSRQACARVASVHQICRAPDFSIKSRLSGDGIILATLGDTRKPEYMVRGDRDFAPYGAIHTSKRPLSR